MRTQELRLAAPETPVDGPLTYRALDVEREVKPFFAVELAREVLESTGARDCQLVYLGYARSADRFVAAYDLSLDAPGPACQVLEVGWERQLFARSFVVRERVRVPGPFVPETLVAGAGHLGDLRALFSR